MVSLQKGKKPDGEPGPESSCTESVDGRHVVAMNLGCKTEPEHSSNGVAFSLRGSLLSASELSGAGQASARQAVLSQFLASPSDVAATAHLPRVRWDLPRWPFRCADGLAGASSRWQGPGVWRAGLFVASVCGVCSFRRKATISPSCIMQSTKRGPNPPLMKMTEAEVKH